MFDLSMNEMLLAGVVALVVLGPERLPTAARALGGWIGKVQRMASGFKQELTHNTSYAQLHQIRDDLVEAGTGIREDMQRLGERWQQETSNLPAWERLPNLKTPADFADDVHHVPVPMAVVHGRSLSKQARARRRDLRPRYRPQPKLRVRKT